MKINKKKTTKKSKEKLRVFACMSYLFDCLIKGLGLVVVELILLSVTILLGGCGGGPRFLEFISLIAFEPGGFICFFIAIRCDNSVLKSTAEPFELLVLVFCGLPPDDGDSLVGDVTPIAANDTIKSIYFFYIQCEDDFKTYFDHRLALTLA